MKNYNKSNIPLAKRLRKNLTPWERKLWYDYLQYYPVRFQRQKSIGNYIVDFYCAKARLAIELDGGGHYNPTQKLQDELRSKQLKSMNISVLRICNIDVDKNFMGVCEYIDNAVKEALPQSASLTAPSTEGAFDCHSSSSFIFALGFFDGVHLGHQTLLRRCVEMARQLGGIPAAITFAAHPQSLFGQAPGLINTNDDRSRLLRSYGIEEIFMLPVTKEVMSTSWQDFLENLLDKGAVGFVCGEDFRFGHQGTGNATALREFCRRRKLSCAVVPDETIDGQRVSSSHIRERIAAGDLENANAFLGHPHILTGEVISGRKLGRTIGIPTANLSLPKEILLPRLGVYACRAMLDGKSYIAVTNIGTRPTVGGNHVTVEPWLLDFDGDLYGKTLTLEFHKFLRPEQKFPTLTALQEEIRKNRGETLNFFQKK